MDKEQIEQFFEERGFPRYGHCEIRDLALMALRAENWPPLRAKWCDGCTPDNCTGCLTDETPPAAPEHDTGAEAVGYVDAAEFARLKHGGENVVAYKERRHHLDIPLYTQPAHGERQAPTYWLIERNQKHGEPSARWFSERIARAGGEQDLWVQDVTRAERFSSKEEAERSIQKRFTDEDEDRYPVLPEATEHIDLAGPNLRDGEGQYHSFADGYNSGIARGIAEGLERAAKEIESVDGFDMHRKDYAKLVRALAPTKQPDAEGADALEITKGALADIAFSDDMTLEVARAKAKRAYEALPAVPEKKS